MKQREQRHVCSLLNKGCNCFVRLMKAGQAGRYGVFFFQGITLLPHRQGRGLLLLWTYRGAGHLSSWQDCQWQFVSKNVFYHYLRHGFQYIQAFFSSGWSHDKPDQPKLLHIRRGLRLECPDEIPVCPVPHLFVA